MLFSTQLPQAVGVAYSLKMDRKDACVATYFGDGGTSEVTSQTLQLYQYLFIVRVKVSYTVNVYTS